MELKAKLASETSDEMMARIEAEQAIRDILLELSDSHGFRIVEDYRYTTREDEKQTDFILQVEDIELRLIVRYCPSGLPTLSRQDLEGFTDVLKNAQGSTALVLVWAAPQLPTLIVTQALIEFMLEEEDRVSAFVGTASPLRDSVLRYRKSQTKEWALRRLRERPGDQVLLETQAILETTLHKQLAKESNRSYRLPRKVAAQKSIAPTDADRVAQILKEARRTSKSADEIADDLIGLVDNWEGMQQE